MNLDLALNTPFIPIAMLEKAKGTLFEHKGAHLLLRNFPETVSKSKRGKSQMSKHAHPSQRPSWVHAF